MTFIHCRKIHRLPGSLFVYQNQQEVHDTGTSKNPDRLDVTAGSSAQDRMALYKNFTEFDAILSKPEYQKYDPLLTFVEQEKHPVWGTFNRLGIPTNRNQLSYGLARDIPYQPDYKEAISRIRQSQELSDVDRDYKDTLHTIATGFEAKLQAWDTTRAKKDFTFSKQEIADLKNMAAEFKSELDAATSKYQGEVWENLALKYKTTFNMPEVSAFLKKKMDNFLENEATDSARFSRDLYGFIQQVKFSLGTLIFSKETLIGTPIEGILGKEGLELQTQADKAIDKIVKDTTRLFFAEGRFFAHQTLDQANAVLNLLEAAGIVNSEKMHNARLVLQILQVMDLNAQVLSRRIDIEQPQILWQNTFDINMQSGGRVDLQYDFCEQYINDTRTLKEKMSAAMEQIDQDQRAAKAAIEYFFKDKKTIGKIDNGIGEARLALGYGAPGVTLETQLDGIQAHAADLQKSFIEYLLVHARELTETNGHHQPRYQDFELVDGIAQQITYYRKYSVDPTTVESLETRLRQEFTQLMDRRIAVAKKNIELAPRQTYLWERMRTEIVDLKGQLKNKVQRNDHPDYRKSEAALLKLDKEYITKYREYVETFFAKNIAILTNDDFSPKTLRNQADLLHQGAALVSELQKQGIPFDFKKLEKILADKYTLLIHELIESTSLRLDTDEEFKQEIGVGHSQDGVDVNGGEQDPFNRFIADTRSLILVVEELHGDTASLNRELTVLIEKRREKKP